MQPQNPDKITSKLTHSAFGIHEILELILSFLSQHILKNITSLVSKQWHKSSCQLIISKVLWRSNHTEEYQLKVMNKFNQANVLTLAPVALIDTDTLSGNNYDVVRRRIAWRDVLVRLHELSTNQEMDRVRVLNLMGVSNIQVFSIAIEKCLSAQLVELNFEMFNSDADFYLQRILKACPRLEALRVSPRGRYVHFQETPEFRPEDPNSIHDSIIATAAALTTHRNMGSWELDENLKLKTLVLERLFVSQRVIHTILSRCPEMRVLKLISNVEMAPGSNPVVLGNTSVQDHEAIPVGSARPSIVDLPFQSYPANLVPFNLDEFISHLAPSCKKLHTFYLSNRSSRAFEKETIEKIMESIPTIRHWGINIKDIASPSLLTSLQGDLSFSLTTLELQCSGLSDPYRSTRPLSKALHNVLCTTPTLLHLNAPMIVYYKEYLKLKPVKLGFKDARSEKPIGDGRFWACRDLKTLHIEFQSYHNQNSLQDDREIYGYLTRATPYLEELNILSDHLRLDIEGGACILTRLHKLERLTFTCRSFNNLQESDLLEWTNREGDSWGRIRADKPFISSSVARSFRLRYRMMMIRSGSIAPPKSYHLSWYDPEGSTKMTTGYETIKYPKLELSDFENLGGIEDIEELQIERMLLHQNGRPCWPHLESLMISLKIINHYGVGSSDFCYKMISDPNQSCKVMLATRY